MSSVREIRSIFPRYASHVCIPLVLVVLLSGCPTADSPAIGFPAGFPIPADFEAFNDQIEFLPEVSVRLVNESNALVQFYLVTGIEGFDGGFAPFEPFVTQVDSAEVLVSPGGSVTGAIKCGEVLGVSARAPADAAVMDLGGAMALGLFVIPGNVAFDGQGTASDSSFTGDLVGSARFIDVPGTGLNCTSDTVVITVTSEGRPSVYENGELVIGLALGVGSIQFEK